MKDYKKITCPICFKIYKGDINEKCLGCLECFEETPDDEKFKECYENIFWYLIPYKISNRKDK